MASTNENFQCPFCTKKFKRESTLTSHKCVKRDRYNARDTRHMKVAFMMWKEFMNFNKLSIPKKVQENNEEFLYFVKSSIFVDFDEFATYVVQNDIFKPEEFITHVITSGIKSRDWCSHKTYQDWVLKCTRYEHPLTGINRSIHALMDWETLTGNPWNTFFKEASITRVIQWFESGKLSPWLIYASNAAADDLLPRITESEYQHLITYIDPSIWIPIQLRYKDDVKNIQNNLKGFGL